MSKYVLVPGDVVDFHDPTSTNVYRGYIDQYREGRDARAYRAPEEKRDYLVKFDKEIWEGYTEAWCAAKDLIMVRPTKTSTPKTVSSTISTPADKPIVKDKQNMTFTSVLQQNQKLSKAKEGYHPWTPYYITSDEFFEILRVAFDDTYGSDTPWHPEDLYINVSSVLEVVSNTLTSMVRMKAGRPLQGVKGD